MCLLIPIEFETTDDLGRMDVCTLIEPKSVMDKYHADFVASVRVSTFVSSIHPATRVSGILVALVKYSQHTSTYGRRTLNTTCTFFFFQTIETIHTCTQSFRGVDLSTAPWHFCSQA